MLFVLAVLMAGTDDNALRGAIGFFSAMAMAISLCLWWWPKTTKSFLRRLFEVEMEDD